MSRKAHFSFEELSHKRAVSVSSKEKQAETAEKIYLEIPAEIQYKNYNKIVKYKKSEYNKNNKDKIFIITKIKNILFLYRENTQ